MECIYINMLGEFSLEYNNKKLNENNNKSKKSWTLLKYLITFRNKEISQAELFDILWAEDESDNPTSALKTLLHRTRHVLELLEVENGNNIIKSANGSYYWNNAFNVIIDVEEFEKCYIELKKPELSDNDKLKLALDAINMYKGNFLAASSYEYWIIPLSTYYSTIYFEIVQLAVNFLYKSNAYPKIIDICKKATSINPYEENYYYHIINSLYETGNAEAALENYNNVKSFFMNNFYVNLSDKFNNLYKKISQTKNNLEFNIEKIHKNLSEAKSNCGAFYCGYDFFRQQYQLEERLARRNGTLLHICLISITNKKGSIPEKDVLTKAMDNIRASICASLRSYDLFAQYSVSQYIVMLKGITYDNADAVLKRIYKNAFQSISNPSIILKCDLKSYNDNTNKIEILT